MNEINKNVFWLIHWQSLLTATSEQLYEATRGRQQWGRVRVMAPANWQHCLRGVNVVDQWPQRFHGNDLLIGRTHPLLADLPWARQFGPCGVQGSDLYLSHRFVQSTASDNLVRHGAYANDHMWTICHVGLIVVH